MNTNLMRVVDLWVGAPLCFVATGLDRLLRRFRKRPAPATPPHRILFIQLAETGGIVVACPAVARAKALFPGAEIFFLSFTLGDGILQIIGVDRDHRVTIRTDGLVRFALDSLRAVLALRRLGIDAIVNLETFARYSTLLAWAVAAPRRVGFHRFHDEGHYVGALLTHRVIYNPHVHAGRTFLALVEALAVDPAVAAGPEPLGKIPVREMPLDLAPTVLTDEAREVILGKLRKQYPGLTPQHKLALLNPNASDLVAARRWPTESFLTLARGLLEDPEVLVVFTGAPNERASVVPLCETLASERVLNMAGETTLPQLIDLFHVSRLLVTNDSGPAHFASLTNLPVLVLFGPETPEIYGPIGPKVQPVYLGLACSPCVSAYNQKRSPCGDNRCLKGISAELVLERARGILAG